MCPAMAGLSCEEILGKLVLYITATYRILSDIDRVGASKMLPVRGTSSLGSGNIISK